ncbi:MAG: phage integrase SAM-like domain-containing protein, partial [Planctomycetia bacterium]|nr:phage integrase SAM-like domain-containing protein [Planctomycetia bacterium]
MEKTREKIKMLIQCRKTGALTEEISVWLFEIQKTSPSVYDRLADLGLCEIRKSKKTIADILSVFRKTRIKSARTTKANFEHVARNILEYFKSNADLTTITPENATAFEYWLRTAPLNKRGKYPVPYAIANVNRRIKYAKQIFEYAVVLGWLEKNPFSVLKGGKSVNPEKTCYIPPEAVYRAIQLVPLRWATVIALGRFGGLRGPSEMHALKWKDICWGDKKNPAYIGIHCKKTKNHGKMYRLVPLYPIVRDLLEQLFEEAKNKKENNTIEKEN